MADKGSNEGSSSGNISAESSDSSLQLNVKTLDSHIYSFQLDKNMSISSFKEKIANETGVPVSQQRLIFRGRVLKDEHVLSEYHLENGHTLHLVERQPNQSQVFGTSSAESTVTNDNQGNDAGPGAPHNRVGQISHSVVLGTINMGEQGEGMVPDLSGVIGAVLNSIGIGGQSRNNVSNTTQTSPPSGNETEGINAVNQNLAGNQAPLPGQTFRGQAFQSLPQVVQIPVPAGSIPIPSLNAPIPHSLNTLSEFINNMEHTLSQNGHRPNLSSTNHGDQPVELPTNAQGLPTLEALSVILRRTGQLLSVNTVAALCHIAGNLEQEGTSDLSVRGQIQSETVQTGIAMQHLGALLLELGRTMLTLRMGQSYAESSVNAGPAVYISPTGPNPIMVQPFPLQTSSLFGGSVPSSTPTPPTLGTVGIGRAPRNVNIHIHAGTSLAPIVSSIGSRPNNGEGTRAEHHSELGSGVGVASGTETGFGISTSQPPPVTTQLSSVLSGINSRLRTIVGNMQAENTALSGQLESTSQDLPANSDSRPALGDEQRDTSEMNGRAATVSTVGCSSESGLLKPQTESAPTCSSGPRDVSVDKVVSHQGCSSRETIAKSEKVQGAPSVSEEQDVAEPGKAAPLGLGMSGLERKKQTRAQPAVSKGSGDGSSGSSANQSQQTRTDGQRLLQTLASHGSTVNLGSSNGPSQQPLPTNGSQIDMAGLMSQVLRSPALNGLLSGVSQQTGVDSQGGLRNMFQQFTQNPQMMNTVNQIAEQVGSQDIENMFAGMGSGQGGGIDLSRMFQQMMPIVSQALGGGTPPPLFSATGPQPQAPNRDGTLDSNNNQSLQPNLQPVVERIEHVSPPADVFRAVAENAAHVSGNGSASNDLLEELCSNESLASEYAEMLRNDVQQRFKEHSELDKS